MSGPTTAFANVFAPAPHKKTTTVRRAVKSTKRVIRKDQPAQQQQQVGSASLPQIGKGSTGKAASEQPGTGDVSEGTVLDASAGDAVVVEDVDVEIVDVPVNTPAAAPVQQDGGRKKVKPLTLEGAKSKWSNHPMKVRERTFDVNLITMTMPAYEPLLDEYLQDYFSSGMNRNHLKKLGLITDEGRIIDKKTFKYNQIHLDKAEYEARIVKTQEDRELDRDIEVAIRRQIEEDKNPRSQRLKRMRNPGSTNVPYPEFLAQYPVTMWKTALLFAQKPAPLMTTEQMLLGRLRSQHPLKLKAMGLTPRMLAARKPGADKRARERREKIWKGEEDDWDAAIAAASQPRLDANQEVAMLLGRACDECEGGDFGALQGTVGRMLELMGCRPEEGRQISRDAETVEVIIVESGVELSSAENLIVHYVNRIGGPIEEVLKRIGITHASPVTEELSKPDDSDGVSSERVRPKSARPTRNSAFPTASDFSDFGSDNGNESDAEILSTMGEDGVASLKVSQEPISEAPEGEVAHEGDEYGEEKFEEETKEQPPAEQNPILSRSASAANVDGDRVRSAHTSRQSSALNLDAAIRQSKGDVKNASGSSSRRSSVGADRRESGGEEENVHDFFGDDDEADGGRGDGEGDGDAENDGEENTDDEMDAVIESMRGSKNLRKDFSSKRGSNRSSRKHSRSTSKSNLLKKAMNKSASVLEMEALIKQKNAELAQAKAAGGLGERQHSAYFTPTPAFVDELARSTSPPGDNSAVEPMMYDETAPIQTPLARSSAGNSMASLTSSQDLAFESISRNVVNDLFQSFGENTGLVDSMMRPSAKSGRKEEAMPAKEEEPARPNRPSSAASRSVTTSQSRDERVDVPTPPAEETSGQRSRAEAAESQPSRASSPELADWTAMANGSKPGSRPRSVASRAGSDADFFNGDVRAPASGKATPKSERSRSRDGMKGSGFLKDKHEEAKEHGDGAKLGSRTPSVTLDRAIETEPLRTDPKPPIPRTDSLTISYARNIALPTSEAGSRADSPSPIGDAARSRSTSVTLKQAREANRSPGRASATDVRASNPNSRAASLLLRDQSTGSLAKKAGGSGSGAMSPKAKPTAGSKPASKPASRTASRPMSRTQSILKVAGGARAESPTAKGNVSFNESIEGRRAESLSGAANGQEAIIQEHSAEHKNVAKQASSKPASRTGSIKALNEATTPKHASKPVTPLPTGVDAHEHPVAAAPLSQKGSQANLTKAVSIHEIKEAIQTALDETASRSASKSNLAKSAPSATATASTKPASKKASGAATPKAKPPAHE